MAFARPTHFGERNAHSSTTFCSSDGRHLRLGRPDLRSGGRIALEACRSTGLIALRERNPSIKDVSFDIDGMTVAKANTKVEGYGDQNNCLSAMPILKKVSEIRGELSSCLIGEKGKVLLTFFTDK